MNEEELDDEFNANVRKCVLFFILLIFLQCLSYAIISNFRKRQTFCGSDREDVISYKISFWTCNFSFSISLGFVLHLPICFIMNEILLFYPDSRILWQNVSFMKEYWDLSVLLSNLAIFILLPFAYFFSESQGLSSSCTGIKGRMYETCCMLAVTLLLIISLVFTTCSIFGYRSNIVANIFNSWDDYFQYFYLLVHFSGIVMLIACTPVGYTHLFKTAIGKLMVQKTVVMNMKSEFLMLICERKHILVKLDGLERDSLSDHQYTMVLKDDLRILNKRIESVESSLWRLKMYGIFIYPIVMAFLLFFTIHSIIIVVQYMLLFFEIKIMPVFFQHFLFGISLSSILDPLLKFILVLYILCSSVIGLYSLPPLHRIKPKFHETPITHMIINCALLLIVSSTLPTLTKVIGLMYFTLSEEMK